jgi:hypothetical protein
MVLESKGCRVGKQRFWCRRDDSHEFVSKTVIVAVMRWKRWPHGVGDEDTYKNTSYAHTHTYMHAHTHTHTHTHLHTHAHTHTETHIHTHTHTHTYLGPCVRAIGHSPLYHKSDTTLIPL